MPGCCTMIYYQARISIQTKKLYLSQASLGTAVVVFSLKESVWYERAGSGQGRRWASEQEEEEGRGGSAEAKVLEQRGRYFSRHLPAEQQISKVKDHSIWLEDSMKYSLLSKKYIHTLNFSESSKSMSPPSSRSPTPSSSIEEQANKSHGNSPSKKSNHEAPTGASRSYRYAQKLLIFVWWK